MARVTEQQLARLEDARGILRGWSPDEAAPSLASLCMSIAFESPAVHYTLSEGWRGGIASAAYHRVERDDIVRTPFMRTDLLFGPTFTIVHEDESPFGIENRPVMGADLQRDYLRWKEFRDKLLGPLKMRDHLRVFLTSKDGHWISLCGVFARVAGAAFSEADRAVLGMLQPDLERIMEAWCTLAPPWGDRNSQFEQTRIWPSPSFACLLSGELLYANSPARRTLRTRPEWLGDALRTGIAPHGWRLAPVNPGVVLVTRDHVGGEWFNCAVEERLAERLKYRGARKKVAFMVIRGLSNKSIAQAMEGELTSSTVDTYVKGLIHDAGAANRTGIVARLFDSCEPKDLWPVWHRPVTRQVH